LPSPLPSLRFVFPQLFSSALLFRSHRFCTHDPNRAIPGHLAPSQCFICLRTRLARGVNSDSSPFSSITFFFFPPWLPDCGGRNFRANLTEPSFFVPSHWPTRVPARPLSYPLRANAGAVASTTVEGFTQTILSTDFPYETTRFLRSACGPLVHELVHFPLFLRKFFLRLGQLGQLAPDCFAYFLGWHPSVNFCVP